MSRAADGRTTPSAGVRIAPGWVGVLVVAVLIVCAGVGFGLAVVGDGVAAGLDPLSDRPHVTDAQAGVGYGIPVGWTRTAEGPASVMTPEIFSSAIGTDPVERPGAVLVGLSAEEGSLAEIATRYPHLVTAFLTGSDEGIDVDPAELVDLAGTTAVHCSATLDSGPQELTLMDIYAFDGSRGVVVVMTAYVDGQQDRAEEIAAVLASLRVI